MDAERKKLEEGMEYEIKNGVIRLKSVPNAINKRLRCFNDNVNTTTLLSVDKGQGRVIVTAAFPYRHDQRANIKQHPSSVFNHLVLASWEGPDNHKALATRIQDIFDILSVEMKLEILLGGDLGFTCANFGIHPAMSQPCPLCSHTFDKSAGGDKNSIPFKPIILPSKKNAVKRKKPIWLVFLENVSYH